MAGSALERLSGGSVRSPGLEARLVVLLPELAAHPIDGFTEGLAEGVAPHVRDEDVALADVRHDLHVVRARLLLDPRTFATTTR